MHFQEVLVPLPPCESTGQVATANGWTPLAAVMEEQSALITVVCH